MVICFSGIQPSFWAAEYCFQFGFFQTSVFRYGSCFFSLFVSLFSQYLISQWLFIIHDELSSTLVCMKQELLKSFSTRQVFQTLPKMLLSIFLLLTLLFNSMDLWFVIYIPGQILTPRLVVYNSYWNNWCDYMKLWLYELLLLIVTYTAASKTWIFLEHFFSLWGLMWDPKLGLSFAWLKKNRLDGRQNCVGDKMEKIVSNLRLSSIATRWADSARAATDLSFHWWGVTALLKCQA